jgi:hypothetical protein
MPTNDERREVARRLRWLTMAYKDVFGVYVLNAIGLDFTNSRGTYCSNDSVRRLADLIEPEPERTCHMERASGYFNTKVITWFCSECGSPIYNDVEPSFCLYCGARVIDE